MRSGHLAPNNAKVGFLRLWLSGNGSLVLGTFLAYEFEKGEERVGGGQSMLVLLLLVNEFCLVKR